MGAQGLAFRDPRLANRRILLAGQLLAADPDVPACMVEQVFTYALGRTPRAEDAASIDRITAAFVASDHRFEALVLALATDPVFTERVPWTD